MSEGLYLTAGQRTIDYLRQPNMRLQYNTLVLYLAIQLVPMLSVGQQVLNGSINGAASGNSQFANLPDWTMCTVFNGWNNTPDICDVAFPSYNGNVTVPVVASPDGGQWAGLANGMNPTEDECIVGTMTGLTTGSSYLLQFYGACFGVGVGNYANGSPVVLTVTMGLDTHYVMIPMASLWNTYCLSFSATDTIMQFSVHNQAGEGYAGVDGFSVLIPSTSSTVTDTTICAGQPIQLGNAIGASTYVWQDGSTNATFVASQPGTYWVQINMQCVIRTDTFILAPAATIPLTLGPDQELCIGDELELIPTTSDSLTYLWSDNSTAATLVVDSGGFYWLTVSGAGCSASDTLYVTEETCAASVEMPNVFSPNSDGENDRFRPILFEGVIDAELIIYNRWGNEVFRTTNVKRGWDGTYNGNACSAGTYFWIVRYVPIKGQAQDLKGTVTLLR